MSQKLPNDGKGRGTYSCFYLNPRSTRRLSRWGKAAGVKNLFSDDEFHITICYSKLPIEYSAAGILPPLPVKPKGFSIFGKEKEYLVLEVSSPFASNRNEYARLLGAVSDFPDYKPHISLAKDSGITDTKDLPPIDFLLYLYREEVSAINPDH